MRRRAEVLFWGKKGFGYLRELRDGVPSQEHIYFHIGDFKGRTSVELGEEVEFELVSTPKGTRAIKIAVPTITIKIKDSNDDATKQS